TPEETTPEETTPEETTPEETTPEETTPEETTPEETTPEETTPEETTPEETTPEETTPEETSSSNIFTIPPMFIDSTVIPKNYGNNFIELPCATGEDFEVSFTVDTQGDLYVAFTDEAGFPSPNLVLESGVGVISGRNTFRSGRYGPPKRDLIKRQTTSKTALITYKYSNGRISAYRDGVLISSSSTYNIPIDKLYFAPLTNTASITGGSVICG
ncbi:hypothetical protein AYI69_g8107, partial [Smittium culicis]